jgi:hypothetical protein
MVWIFITSRGNEGRATLEAECCLRLGEMSEARVGDVYLAPQ